MENQIKSKFWKFTFLFFGVIIAIFVLYFAGIWGLQKYNYWQDMKKAKAYEEGIKKWQQEDYEKAMADIYGGKTPQETLQMYIEAVEKGDYELASKYFIGEKQEGELKSLKNFGNSVDISSKEKINEYLNFLRPILNKGGEYAMDKNYFSFNGEILVNMKLYPNGIWKIIEI